MSHHSTADVDYTILGAGIAGLSLADELLLRNKTVAIIDKNQPGSGSSGAPLVLVNPATGRRAKMVKDAANALSAVKDLLQRVEDHSGRSIFTNNGVLRPALDRGLAKDFRRSPQKYDWPDPSWINWLDKKTFAEKYSWFGETYGGLVVRQGLTANANLYSSLLAEYLKEKGLKTFYNTNASIQHATGDPHLNINPGTADPFKTGRIIYATGSAVKKSKEWSYLNFSTTKGQLLDLQFESPLPLEESISSMGYFAFLPQTPKRLVAGSTYEHHYENLKTDSAGKEYLYKKLDRTLPGFSARRHNVSMWSGERVSVKDHKPVLGSHPHLENRYLLSGLGSKGMIQGRYLAKMLIEYIEENKPIDPGFSLDRFPFP